MADTEWLIWLVVIVAACLGYWLVGYIFDELGKARPKIQITRDAVDPQTAGSSERKPE